jgi:hypothetical protein
MANPSTPRRHRISLALAGVLEDKRAAAASRYSRMGARRGCEVARGPRSLRVRQSLFTPRAAAIG